MSSRIFDVLVMAPVSAGKTSLVNALIGSEILYSGNEAATACSIRIEHRSRAKYFSAACFSGTGQLIEKLRPISPEQLRLWNSDEHVQRIAIAGRFASRPVPARGLVLHDTPGPNNSLDGNHSDLAFQAVRTVPFNLILYVLDASQLGTSDDRCILERLRQETASRSRDAFGFVLNKVDLLDAEKGEGLASYLEKTSAYLTDVGFDDPVIIPSMASKALYARKALHGEALSRFQRIKLQQALAEIPLRGNNLLETARVPAQVKKRLQSSLRRLQKNSHRPTGENELRQLIISSGLGTVEAFIEHRRKLDAPV